nr:PREDICTED: coiled-coil domain-containing protein 42 homolog [Paralichthys olivaceus]
MNRSSRKDVESSKPIQGTSPSQEPDDIPSTGMLTQDILCKYQEIEPIPEAPRTWWQSAVFTPLMKARCNFNDAKDNLLKTSREDQQRKQMIEECVQMLKHLQKRIDELQKENQETKELKLKYSLFLREKEVQRTADEAKREREEALEKEKLLEKLKEETAELMERKDHLDHQLQMYTVYEELMEKIQRMTEFKDAELLTDNLESQLLLREQLYQRECEAKDQVQQHEKAVAALLNERDLMRMQKRNQLFELQTKMEDLLSDVKVWELKWNRIQKVSAHKTIRLAQAKVVTLDLYEKTGGKLKADGVCVNDTGKQLDKILMFIREQDEVLRRLKEDKSVTSELPTPPR